MKIIIHIHYSVRVSVSVCMYAYMCVISSLPWIWIKSLRVFESLQRCELLLKNPADADC